MAGKKMALYIAAATTIAVAGMIHLMLGPNSLRFNVNQGILFIVGGIAQVFWIMPMIRRWGRKWYSIGIGGTATFMTIFFITRMPGNPITGRGAPAGNPMAIAVEVFEGIFIVLAAVILVYESRVNARQIVEKKNETGLGTINAPRRKQVPILAGIVVVFVLAGLFVLPMAMPRPMGGGPPGQFGGPPGQVPPATSPQQPVQQAGSLMTSCKLTPSLIEVEDTPQQTEGPYFVDEKLNRSDVRSDPPTALCRMGFC